jgi:hypothetical protein
VTGAHPGAAPEPLVVDLPRSAAGRFAALLQHGVALRARAPTAWAFLTEELGVDPKYVKERVTTIFLDGQVVDDLERAPLRDGSLLALSAAMPGLVGATLRRGGYYAAMRAAITHSAGREADAGGGEHVVRVKLFNLLIAELGPVLLARGIVLARDEAAALLAACGLTAALSPGARRERGPRDARRGAADDVDPGGAGRGDGDPGAAIELRVRFEEERS